MARFNAGVLGISFEKSNVNISQAPARVVVSSVSTLTAPLVASSTFKRIGVPASGDHTMAVITVLLAVNGMAVAKPVPIGSPIVVPAHTAAVAVFSACPTVLDELVGSATTAEILPPKSVIA